MTRQQFNDALQEGIADTIKKNVQPFVDDLKSMESPDTAETHIREVMNRIFRVHAIVTDVIDINIKD